MSHDQNTVRRREPRLEDLATYLQRAREQERAHLARELHDELGALLMAAKLDVACLRMHLGAAPADIARRVAHLGEILNEGIALKSRIVEGLALLVLSKCPHGLAKNGPRFAWA